MNDSDITVLLTEHEAAERLRLKVRTLRNWRWTGGGPSWVKLMGAVRYKASDLEAFIKAGERQAAA